MKIKSVVSIDGYSLNINKEYFISKYEKEKGKAFATRLYYICYLTYEKILKLNKRLDEEIDKNIIKNIILKLEFFENRLQKLWGFIPNKAFHIYWNHSKSCSCSCITKSYKGLPNKRIYDSECKIHSL